MSGAQHPRNTVTRPRGDLRPTRRTWLVVVAVGAPLLLAMALGLDAAGANSSITGIGASVLATLVAGRAARLRGATRWLAAWLLVLGTGGLIGLLVLPWDMPG